MSMLLRRMMMMMSSLVLHTLSSATGLVTFVSHIVSPMKSITVGFKPTQDLRGYDNPWPEGGGTNMIPDGTDTSKGYVANKFVKSDGALESSNIGYYVSEYFPVTEGAAYTYSTNRTSAVNPCVAFYDASYQFISATPVGSTQLVTVTAPTGAVYARASQLSAWEKAGDELFQLESGSAATTPKPYSNICPIAGRNDISAWFTGKNICGGEYLLEKMSYALPGGTTNKTNKTFTFTSGTTAEHWVFSYYNYPFKPNTQYTFIITCSKSSGTSTNFRVYHTDGTYHNISAGTTSKTTVAFVSDAGKTVRNISKYSGSGTTTLYYEESGIFEGVLTASDFEAYSGGGKTVSFAQGKNLYSGDITTGYYINSTGQIASTSSSCFSPIIPVAGGSTYTYSGVCGASANTKRVHGYIDGIWTEQITALSSAPANTAFSCTFTVPDGVNGIRISARTDDTNVQVELGSSATSYEAYSGTVYGGTCELVNGSLIKIKDAVVADENSAWVMGNAGIFYIKHSLNEYVMGSDNLGQYLCNKYPYRGYITNTSQVSADGFYANLASNSNGKKRIVIKDTRFTTLEAFKASLAGSPIVICALLTTPVEISRPGQPINTQQATNNVWNGACWDLNDDGITVEYYDNQ